MQHNFHCRDCPLGPDALALAQYNAQYRVDTSTRIVLALHKVMRNFCACQDKVSGSTPLHTVSLFIAVALSRYAISLMRNVDCPSSFPQLRKANQGFNPITSLLPHLLVLSQTLWEGIVTDWYQKNTKIFTQNLGNLALVYFGTCIHSVLCVVLCKRERIWALTDCQASGGSLYDSLIT